MIRYNGTISRKVINKNTFINNPNSKQYDLC